MSQYSEQINKLLIMFQKDGQIEYFEELFKISTVHMLYIARIYLKNKSLAEDVVSESYVKIFRHINSFDSSQNGFNWMWKIVQNIAYDFNDRENRTADSEEMFRKDNCQDVYTMDLSELEFLSSIDCLDDIDRIILFRRFCLDEQVEVIAKSLNMSKSTISQRTKKAFAIIEKKNKSNRNNS